MAASDAKNIPIKNQAYRLYMPVLTTAGDVIALPGFDTGLGSGSGKAMVAKDGGVIANSTNSITGGGGGYNTYVDLTATEMNADAVMVIFRCTTASAIDAWTVLYPEPRGLRDLAYPAVSGRSLDVAAAGGVTVASLVADAITAASIAAGAIGNTEVADGFLTTAKFADGTLTAAKFADAFLTAAKVATDAIDNDAISASALLEIAAAVGTGAAGDIANAVWDEALVEPAAVPAVTASMRQALAFLLVLARNKRTQTSSTEVLRNDADSATIGSSAKTDDGTTFTRGEWA
jgi:hypothetical protein